MTFDVTLTFAEVALAHQVAGQRMILAMKNRQRSRYGAAEGFSNERVGLDFIGCLGEAAVAKACNRYWSPAAGEIGGIDVGGVVEVRSVSKPTHHLILNVGDSDDLPYVLADISSVPVIKLRGWIFGRDGRREEWWRDPGNGRPNYFVPHSALRDFNELINDVLKVAA